MRLRLLAVATLLAGPLAAQSPAPRVLHTVEVRDPATRAFHVTSRFLRVDQLPQRWIDLALPTWTPGWYVIEDYAKHVRRLEFTDGRGKRLPWYMTDRSTWRVDTRGASEVQARFEYEAVALGLNQARITDDWAFFTGTQLFLEPVGYTQWASSVRFARPDGWRLLTSLRDTDDSLTFTAANYHELVDATTQMGRFDAKRFEVDGKPHWFIAAPAGALSGAQLDTMADHAARIARVQARVFAGTLPYPKYLYHYFFLPAETNAGGGLEHANSHVSIVGPLGDASPTAFSGLLAHEFFHLWNVKRLRPAEMWPYDYSDENVTPNLWVSEGFTNYYASMTLLRAGLQDRARFLAQAANAITTVESNEARSFVSIADASTSTWLGYDRPQAFTVNYYAGGQVVAAMLDLAILHHTNGAARLDEVLRTLWREQWARGQGFTRAQFQRAVDRTARHDLGTFVQRMVDWRQVPPYDSLLAFAGYRLDRTERQLPVMGMTMRTVAEGNLVQSVTPGGGAERAGLRVGDVVVSLEGQPIARADLAQQIGREVRLEVLRGGERRTHRLRMTGRAAPSFRIVELPQVSEAQRRIRELWLAADR